MKYTIVHIKFNEQYVLLKALMRMCPQTAENIFIIMKLFVVEILYLRVTTRHIPETVSKLKWANFSSFSTNCHVQFSVNFDQIKTNSVNLI